MKRTISLIVSALASMCCLNVIYAQGNGNALTNEDILTLTAGNVSERVIVERIHSGDTDFDTSAEALVLLSQAGTHEQVLIAIVRAGVIDDRCTDESASD